MPYETKRIGGKWRIVRGGTNEIATNEEGRPLDSGGHDQPHDLRRRASIYNETFKDPKAKKVGSGTGKRGGGPFSAINRALSGARK